MEQGIILLVEDNEHLNEINRRALEGEDYTVLTAHCLAEARAHLAAAEPDVILLDIALRTATGLVFARKSAPGQKRTSSF